MTCSRYIKLLLWPVFLCYDYSMDAVPLVESLVDSRLGGGNQFPCPLRDAFNSFVLWFKHDWTAGFSWWMIALGKVWQLMATGIPTCQVLKIWCTASLSSIGCFYHCSHIWASCFAPATWLEHWCQSYLWYLDWNSTKQLKINYIGNFRWPLRS